MGGVEADMLGSRGCGCDRARNAASRQTLSRAVTDVGHHHTRRPPSFDHMASGGVGPGGLLGWFPRVLRRTPLLRGPRVALVRLFEPSVSSCLSLEEEEGLEGRQVGISGGGGAFACPRPGTHSRSQPSQDNSFPQDPTEKNAVCESSWQPELLMQASTRRSAPKVDSGIPEELA